MPRGIRAAVIARIVEQGLSRKQAERAYSAILEGVTGALARGETVTLRNFGRFSPRVRPFRWCQIPHDGEIVRIPEHTLISFRPAAALRRAVDSAPDDPYFDAIFARRRQNSRQLLSQPETDLDTPVYDTQFDLGIAFREMGLLDKALDHFRSALDLIEQRERSARFVQCCYMLGLCHRDVGDNEVAMRWFQQGLASPRRPQVERFEFRYQIGLLLATDGRIREALNELLQVYLVNPHFREIAQHVHSLKELRRAQMGAGARFSKG
jgi:nucleoid DNA-binding protein